MNMNMENKLIATNGETDFWYIEGQVYRCKPTYDADGLQILDVYGFPPSRRWECSYEHWLKFKDTVFSWVSEVK